MLRHFRSMSIDSNYYNLDLQYRVTRRELKPVTKEQKENEWGVRYITTTGLNIKSVIRQIDGCSHF